MKLQVAWLCGLLTVALMLVVTMGQEEEEPTTYVGLKGCVCHKLSTLGNQIGHWKEKDPHSKAYESLKGEESRKVASLMGIDDPLTDKRCIRCHATAYGVPEGQRGSLTLEDGIACESCHGPGSRYAKKQIMNDRELALASGLLLLHDPDDRIVVCGRCHNEDVPKEFHKELDFVTDWEPYKHTLPPAQEE